MSLLTWDPKDPDDVADFVLDWSDQLDTGDTISSSSWGIQPSDELTEDSNSYNDDYTTIWLSGGEAGTTYRCENTITTADGRTYERSVTLEVKNL